MHTIHISCIFTLVFAEWDVVAICCHEGSEMCILRTYGHFFDKENIADMVKKVEEKSKSALS